MKVLVTSYYDPSVTDRELRRLGPAANVVRPSLGHRLTEPELIEQLPGVHVAVVSDEVFGEPVFAAADKLRMICADGVGVDSIELGAATRHGVIVNNAPFVHEANGEFTIGLILAVIRRIAAADRGVRAGRWDDRARYFGRDLGGCTLGLLGFGRAARNVAWRAHGFGPKLLAYSPHANAGVASELGVTVVSFDQLLAQSDILSIHVSLNDQTRGMVDADAIAKMKPGSYLINTSRGAVVDEPALVEALRSGHLAGAGLDVFQAEPPPVDSHLLGLENVVVTAHMASDSVDAFRAVFRGVVDDILLFAEDKRPSHVVNTDVLEHPNFVNMTS